MSDARFVRARPDIQIAVGDLIKVSENPLFVDLTNVVPGSDVITTVDSFTVTSGGTTSGDVTVSDAADIGVPIANTAEVTYDGVTVAIGKGVIFGAKDAVAGQAIGRLIVTITGGEKRGCDVYFDIK